MATGYIVALRIAERGRLVLAATVVMIAIRTPHGRCSRIVKVVRATRLRLRVASWLSRWILLVLGTDEASYSWRLAGLSPMLRLPSPPRSLPAERPT